MTAVPENPKIYHITHIHNLGGIVHDGVIWSDARRNAMGLECAIVGMSKIKHRRLNLPVNCHPETTVGQYVPFYFCPRSVMLFILHRGNHQEISYREGQGPIIHLQADLEAVIQWAESHSIRWAFSKTNAGASYTRFYKKREELVKIDWPSVNATDFRDRSVQENKQAEFLVYESFPWYLVEKIGVIDETRAEKVGRIIGNSPYQPLVSVEGAWYY
jgi:hypothetical protein